jgi:predicted Zn-ribbon and HTH transcriptional regulator
MSTLKKLNINLNTLKSEAQKFKTELTKVSKQLKPQAQEKLHQAEAMYKKCSFSFKSGSIGIGQRIRSNCNYA